MDPKKRFRPGSKQGKGLHSVLCSLTREERATFLMKYARARKQKKIFDDLRERDRNRKTS